MSRLMGNRTASWFALIFFPSPPFVWQMDSGYLLDVFLSDFLEISILDCILLLLLDFWIEKEQYHFCALSLNKKPIKWLCDPAVANYPSIENRTKNPIICLKLKQK